LRDRRLSELEASVVSVVPMTESHVGAPIDANGNLTADGTRTFEWDARNQQVAVNVGTHRSEYSYDGFRRRVRVIERESGALQTETRVAWCGTELCEERAAGGETVTRRAFPHGEQVGGVQRYFVNDHLGSVHDVTDASGALLTRYAFDPWGRRTVTGGADVTDAGISGHRQTTSGLSLALYRGYDAELGRWLNEDPNGFKGGINFYDYNYGNPINRIDPLGLAPQCTTLFQILLAELESTRREALTPWELKRAWAMDTGAGDGIPDNIVECLFERRVKVTTVTTQHWFVVERCQECDQTWTRVRIRHDEVRRRSEERTERTIVDVYVSLIIAAPPEEQCRRRTPTW
jgi:RHS repeat-associated protein